MLINHITLLISSCFNALFTQEVPAWTFGTSMDTIFDLGTHPTRHVWYKTNGVIEHKKRKFKPIWSKIKKINSAYQRTTSTQIMLKSHNVNFQPIGPQYGQV